MRLLLVLFFITSLYSNEFEYYIQTLSTTNKEYLEKMILFSQNNKLTTITRESPRDDKLYFRLLIGPYLNREEAIKNLPKIKELFGSNDAFISKFRKETLRRENRLKEIRLKGFKAYQEKDFENMMKYLIEASNLGDMEATYYTGKNYLYGYGVEKDISTAIKWFEKCESEKICLEVLANIYLDYNNEMEPNLDKAKKYLEKAIKKGSKKANTIVENWDSIKKAHTILKDEDINLSIIETVIRKHLPNKEVENIQIVNNYLQDGKRNLNVTVILDKKVRDIFIIMNKNKFGYWSDIEFKIF